MYRKHKEGWKGWKAQAEVPLPEGWKDDTLPEGWKRDTKPVTEIDEYDGQGIVSKVDTIDKTYKKSINATKKKT